MERFKDLARGDLDTLLRSLIAGEVLTKRGEPGPLARIWRVKGRRSGPEKCSAGNSSAGNSSAENSSAENSRPDESKKP